MTLSNKETFWQKHVEAQEQSNLTRARYCKQHNIVCSRLVYWRIRFKKSLAKKSNQADEINLPNNDFIKLGATKAKPHFPQQN